MRSLYRSTRGFTLTELVVALAVFLVMSASAMALYGNAVPTIRANGQVNRVLSLLQNGREAAIAKQRLHEVRFDLDTSTIELVRLEGEDEVAVETVGFEYSVQLMQFPDAGDTPDGYGVGSAADFGGAIALRFDADGSFVDGSGLPINGTFYLGIAGNPSTARAITVTGSTGRARFYVWTQNQEWEGGWLAK